MIVEKGDKVKVDYTGKLDSGEVFDTSTHGDHSHPIEFVVGAGMVIPGFEAGVIGMAEGEEKEIVLEPKDAYGMPNKELVRPFPRDQIPLAQEPEVGMVLAMQDPASGQQFPVKIDSFDEKTITLDLNPPLAGQTLHFEVKIAGIEKAKAEEKEDKKSE